MLLLCSFFRLRELFLVKNGLTTSPRFLFFFENAKNLVRSDDATRGKKRGWPNRVKSLPLCTYQCKPRGGGGESAGKGWGFDKF